MTKFNMKIYESLRTEAQKSTIDQQLAAAITKGSKMITRPYCNSSQYVYRGMCVGSLHAEARAIKTHFGSSLTYDSKKGWCFLSRRSKKSKD